MTASSGIFPDYQGFIGAANLWSKLSQKNNKNSIVLATFLICSHREEGWVGRVFMFLFLQISVLDNLVIKVRILSLKSVFYV